MKVLLLTLWAVSIASFLSSVSHAQSFALSRGSYLISGNASYANSGYTKDFKPDAPVFETNSDTRYTELRFNPNVLYFILPGLAVGGELNLYRFSNDEGNSSHTYRIGPAIRYYYGGPERKFHPYFSASVNAAITESSYADYNHSGYRASGGVLSMLSSSVGLNGELFYDVSKADGDYGTYDSVTTDVFGLAIGLSIFLFR